MSDTKSTVVREHQSSDFRMIRTTLERDARGRHQIRVTFCGKGKNGGWFEQRSTSFLPSEAVAVSSSLDRALDQLSRQTGDNQ